MVILNISHTHSLTKQVSTDVKLSNKPHYIIYMSNLCPWGSPECVQQNGCLKVVTGTTDS